MAAILLPALAHANGASETFTHTSLLLILMITLADICGFIFERLGMAEILGKIYAGILLGNLALVGIDFNLSALLRSSEFMEYSSELALVLLLFLVGLKSDVRELLKVGRNAVSVAVAGVALPVVLGIGACAALGFATGLQSWFVGAMLAATSVGITARILDENGLLKTRSAEVILGAAVIDDVLGILLLAVLASVVVTGEVAPLIGAFVAGLLLDDVDFHVGDALQKHTLEELVKPISDIMITIFFVGIGAQVQLEILLDPQVLLIIGVLTLVAVVSKGAADFMVAGRGYDRLGIGIGIGFGMILRGEVGPLLLKPRLAYFPAGRQIRYRFRR